jgi:phospholipid/cholesterol/gamma-HCH transport system substrate-binding protein
MTFILLSVALVYYGADKLLFQQKGGPTLSAEFTDASGVLPRNDVTQRGVVIGTVQDVALTETGVKIDMVLNPGTEIPEGTKALIVRRSPIGELTIELDPGNGPPMENGASIPVADTVPPPDVSTTIEAIADVLHAVPSEDLTTVVSELAAAVDGRAEDLARFSEASAVLPERLLEIRTELTSLIENSPKITSVFADNAEVFADDITQTAGLAEILRDRRFDLVELYDNGGDFSRIAGDFISDEKANLACLIRDAGTLNSELVEHLDDIAAVLEDNHFFFDAAEQAVQKDNIGGTWFRVQLLPHTEPQARSYHPQRGTPNVFPGRGCTSRYGAGVGPATEGNAILAPKSEIKK